MSRETCCMSIPPVLRCWTRTYSVSVPTLPLKGQQMTNAVWFEGGALQRPPVQKYFTGPGEASWAPAEPPFKSSFFRNKTAPSWGSLSNCICHWIRRQMLIALSWSIRCSWQGKSSPDASRNWEERTDKRGKGEVGGGQMRATAYFSHCWVQPYNEECCSCLELRC